MMGRRGEGGGGSCSQYKDTDMKEYSIFLGFVGNRITSSRSVEEA